MINQCNIKDITIGIGQPKVCVSVTGINDNEMLAQLDKILLNESYNKDVDVIEFRADYYTDIEDTGKLINLLGKFNEKLSKKILLFTIRSGFEGGENKSLNYEDITRINLEIIKSKAVDMVDVELFSGEELVKSQISAAKASAVKIIMSNHDFDTTPEKSIIIDRLKIMQEYGADIAKIAVMPNNHKHVLDLIEATYEMYNEYAKVPLVTISMGAKGAITRTIGQMYGNAMTFAALEGGSAPGQIPISKLSRMLEVIDDCLN